MKKTTILLSVLSMTFSIHAQFTGSGTVDNPFVLGTAADLENLKNYNDPNFTFRLNNDIRAYDFVPIEEFKGTLEGNQHVLYLSNPFIINLTQYGEIRNLGVFIDHVGDGPDSSIEGISFGAIACNVSGIAKISGCFVAGTMTNMGNGQIGGIAGVMKDNSSIINCKSYVSIESNGTDVGGIVGYKNNTGTSDGYGVFENCYVHGTIKGAANVGGIIGRIGNNSYNSAIDKCVAYAMIYGEENVGGLIGFSHPTAILANCYVHGVVKGRKYIGGIAGYAPVIYTHPQPLFYSAALVDARETEERTAGMMSGYTTNGINLGYQTILDATIGNAVSRIGTMGNSYGIDGVWVYPTSELMNLSYWNYYERGRGYGYPVFQPDQDADRWRTYPTVQNYISIVNPSLMNSLVKWECFGLERFTLWSDVVRSGAYLNYADCDMFEIPEPVVPCYAGNGTAAEPYEISTPEQLDCMMDYLSETNGTNEHFRIMNDIELFDYLLQNYPTSGWRGNEITSFNGYIHGGGHVISGMWMSHENDKTVGGLIAGTSVGAVIDSLGIIFHARGLTALSEAGGLVGRNEGIIYSCFTTGGSIITNNDVDGTGGLVGLNTGSIEDSYSTSNVLAYSSGNSHAGGLAGVNNGGAIMYSYAAGNVIAESGSATTGGLVGTNYSGMVRFNYFDMQTTHHQNGIGNDVPGNNNRYVYGNTTAEMKDIWYVDLLDFDYTWNLIPNYYPFLKWQREETAPFRMIMARESDDETGETFSFIVYPNPTTGMVYIEADNPEIIVYDLNGAIILKTNEKAIDMTSYPKGMYLLNINGLMEKLIKQ